MHRIIPERPNGLVFDVSTADPDVLQRFVAQAGKQLAFSVQFVPAAKLVQQVGNDMAVAGKFCVVYILSLTFHRVALLVDGSSLALALRSIQRMFLMAFITEIHQLSAYPSIDTDVLRTFVAIADQGGFTRAGEMVNRTQSAVSMQMKRLEEDVLQRQLFERDGRQVRLTAEGQVLLGYARRILKLHSEVFNTLREPHMVGLVRIGTPDDYVMRFRQASSSNFPKPTH